MERSRQVSVEESEAYAASIGAPLFGTSAKLNRGVEQAFLAIARSACPRAVWRRRLLARLTAARAHRAGGAAQGCAAGGGRGTRRSSIPTARWHRGAAAGRGGGEAKTACRWRLLLTPCKPLRADHTLDATLPLRVRGAVRHLQTSGCQSASARLLLCVLIQLVAERQQAAGRARVQAREHASPLLGNGARAVDAQHLLGLHKKVQQAAASARTHSPLHAPACMRSCAHLRVRFHDVAYELLRRDNNCAAPRTDVTRHAV